MRSEAAAQVLNCRQAVDDPEQTVADKASNHAFGS